MERDFETKPCVSAETNHGRRLHRLHVLLAARPAEHSSRHVACYQPCLGWGRGRMEPGPRACGTANRRLPRRQRQRRLHASGSAGSTTRRRAELVASPTARRRRRGRRDGGSSAVDSAAPAQGGAAATSAKHEGVCPAVLLDAEEGVCSVRADGRRRPTRQRTAAAWRRELG
jgi:hypothetical protein